ARERAASLEAQLQHVENLLSRIEEERFEKEQRLLQFAGEQAELDLASIRMPEVDRAQLEMQIHQAEIRKREAEYTGLRKRLAQVQAMAERHMATPGEIVQLETQVAVALAELQKAQAEFA